MINVIYRETNAKRKLDKKGGREWDSEKVERLPRNVNSTPERTERGGRGAGRGRGRGRGTCSLTMLYSNTTTDRLNCD